MSKLCFLVLAFHILNAVHVLSVLVAPLWEVQVQKLFTLRQCGVLRGSWQAVHNAQSIFPAD